MRVMLGLIGLLATVGAMAYILNSAVLPETQAVLQQQEKLQPQLEQLAGRTSSGKKVEETYDLYADERPDGKLDDFQVSRLDADSPLQSYFGLRKNDVILTAIDSHAVETKMQGNPDEDLCRLAVREAFTNGGKLVIQRGDQQLTLPPAGSRHAALGNQDSGTPGGEGNTMDEIHGRLHSLPTY